MNRISRTLLSFSMMLLVLLAGSVSVSAAVKPPASVSKLTAKQYSETAIKLSWKKVSKASGYYIYQIDAAGKMKQVGKTSKTSFIVKKLKINTPYSFCVYSYKKSGKSIYKSTAPSKTVTAKTKIYTPGVPTDFHVTSSASKTLNLSWKKAKNATGYAIFRYDAKKKDYVEIARTKNTKQKITGLTNGETNRFVVRSYRTVQGVTSWSKNSSVLKAASKELSPAVKSIRGAYYKTKLKKTTVVQNLTKKKTQTLAKGTSIIANAKTGTYVVGYLSNKDKIKVKRTYLTYINLDSSRKNDYSKSVKEEFVNAKGYFSRSKWLIWISQYKCTVNVFKGSQGNWTLKKEFPCIVGKWSTRTPTGTSRILYKTLNGKYNGVYLQFTPNGNAFHERIDGTPLGRAASHGCVRMRHNDLKYLYNNCPVGTTVISY